MSLAFLLDVPMSLIDRHFISPFGKERAYVSQMLEDTKKRLTNDLKDANLPNDKVDKILYSF